MLLYLLLQIPLCILGVDIILDISKDESEGVTKVCYDERGVYCVIYTPTMSVNIVEVRDSNKTLWRAGEGTFRHMKVHLINEVPILVRIYSPNLKGTNFVYFKNDATCKPAEVIPSRRGSTDSMQSVFTTSPTFQKLASHPWATLRSRVSRRSSEKSLTFRFDSQQELEPREAEWKSISEDEYYKEVRNLRVPKTLHLAGPVDDNIFIKCAWKQLGTPGVTYTPRGRFVITKVQDGEEVIWISKAREHTSTSVTVYGEEWNPKFIAISATKGTTNADVYFEKEGGEYFEISQDALYERMAKMDDKSTEETRL